VEAQTAREAAEKSDRVKSAFLASMSHELRTPLNAVINLTKFVAQGDLGPVNPEQEETLMESVDSARHLLNLINDVLDMSKIEAGSLNLFVRDDVDLAKIIDSMTVTARSLIGEKTIEIRTEISPDLPHIRADEQRIRQILLNMIANATKFTEEGYIEIRAHTENSHVIIAVEDTGPGISVQDQEAVFEAFKQTDSGLRKGGGTGLGMPISKNLAEIHGGKLWLDSGTGKGSTFFVSLPIRSDDLTPAL
jgi:signal transduction histidine kinase